MKKCFSFFFLVLSLMACNPQNKSNNSHSTVPESTVRNNVEGEGGSTNVGGGGIGVDAKWKEIASEIQRNIQKLAVSKVDDSIFLEIQKRLPDLIKQAKVEFKDYSLVLGVEKPDVDQTHESSQELTDNCKNSVTAGPQERDAINFSTSQKIKVNRSRFNCYDPKGAEIRKLVLHEYLGLMGLSETENGVTHYKITNQLLEDFKSIPLFDKSLQVKLVSSCAELQKIGDAAPSENQFHTRDLPPQVLWRLTQDLDCPGTHKPRVLTGNFEGDGFAIRNLTNFLFETICENCTVSNLRLIDSKVEGVALLAKTNRGTISQVSVSGEIRTAWSENTELYTPIVVGGLVASNKKGSLQSVRVDIRINVRRPSTGKELAIGAYSPVFGGLAGYNENGSIQLAKVKLIIRNGVGRMGGVVGVNTGSIRQVQTSISIAAQSALSIGGLIGLNTGKIENAVVNGRISVNGSKIQILDPSDQLPLNLGSYSPGIGGFIGNLQTQNELRSEMGIHNISSVADVTGNVSICGKPLFDIQRPALQKWAEKNPNDEPALRPHLRQTGYLKMGNEIGQLTGEPIEKPLNIQNKGSMSAQCER